MEGARRVTAARLSSFVTFLAAEESGEPVVMFIPNKREFHYVMSLDVARELAIGLQKALLAEQQEAG